MHEEIKSNQMLCLGCGADLRYSPGTHLLVCEHCGTENVIEVEKAKITENDYMQFIQNNIVTSPKISVTTVSCQSCGATTTFDENVTSHECAFCGVPITTEPENIEGVIQPAYLLPFRVKKEETNTLFRLWLKKLWFAPNKLKLYARNGKLSGVYIPYWTFDSESFSEYTGQRGDDYQATTTYTNSEGKKETKTETRTRWTDVSGTVSYFFDDVLVVASHSLPEKLQDELEPWDLDQLVAFNTDFLRGFKTESYKVTLEEGFGFAKVKMDDEIKVKVKKDIGGDRQKISNIDTDYSNISFKHILLPIWISAYQYNNKTYRFIVNGRTGEVQGERPYSWIKIAFAVLIIILFILMMVYFSE